MVSATLRRHDEQITNLTFQLNQFKEREAALVKSLNSLNKRVARLSSENVELKKQSTVLSRTLRLERSTREAEMNNLLKEVSKQTAEALRAAAKARAAALSARQRKSGRSTAAGGGPVGKGEFYVHTVERGATLGAIAKAYKVTVSEIKKANRLTSDAIRVGQKLYIPKK